jgi:glycosyltransferase involved in cell wall biosynthesis
VKTVLLESLVSVIVPCFNHGEYLAEAVGSIFEQSYSHVEVIIVNDGSGDTSDEIARHMVDIYADRAITYLVQENKGPAAARNLGLQAAKGKYIVFLDADDLLDPGQLATETTFLEDHPDCSVAYGGGRYFGDNNLFRKRPSNLWGEYVGDALSSFISRGNFILIHSAMFHSSILARIGYFDEELHLLEDWDFWMRCAAEDLKFSYVPGVTVPYRIHGGNVTEGAVRMVQARINVLRKVKAYFQISTDQATVADKQLVIAYLGLASRLLDSGDRSEAEVAIKKAAVLGQHRALVTAYRLGVRILPTKVFVKALKIVIRTL